MNNIELQKNGWFTNNRYCDTNVSKELPETECVYIIYGIVFIPYSKEILYIGRSKNLKKRIRNHEVINTLLTFNDHYQVYFKETKNSNLLEKDLIKANKPIFNIQYIK